MRAVWLWLGAGVIAISAPSAASAFCRITTDEDAVCGEVGEPLWWGTACLSYAIDENGSQWLDQADTRAAVDAGFTAWSSVDCDGNPTDFQFRRLEDSVCAMPEFNQGGANVNTIAFLDPWIDPRDNSVIDSRVLGFTVVSHDTQTGEIWDADMLINDQMRLARCSPDFQCSGFDVQSIVTHEAGHFIGIAHSQVEEATMFFQTGSAGDIELRSLEQDDVDATCTIHPPGSLESECNDADFVPRGGLDLNCEDAASNGGGGCSVSTGRNAQTRWSWTLLGVVLLVRPRRRVSAS